MSEVQLSAISKINSLWKRLKSKAYRDAFVSAKVDGDLAAQIYALREQRGLTQEELGSRASMAQSRIAKLEGSCEGVSVGTLKRIAAAFDVSLQIRFVPFSETIASTVRGSLDRSIPDFPNDDAPVLLGQVVTGSVSGRNRTLPKARTNGQTSGYVRALEPTRAFSPIQRAR